MKKREVKAIPAIATPVNIPIFLEVASIPDVIPVCSFSIRASTEAVFGERKMDCPIPSRASRQAISKGVDWGLRKESRMTAKQLMASPAVVKNRAPIIS